MLNRHRSRHARRWGCANYLPTQLTLGGAAAAMTHGPLLCLDGGERRYFVGIAAWPVALFGLGYVSALAAALASGAKNCARSWSC